MRIEPKTEKQIQEMNLWPVGEYGFEILSTATIGGTQHNTCETVSRNDKDMIQLVVKLFNDEGKFRILRDFLLESMAFKLRHAAEACGLLNNYERGELLADDFIGKTGIASVFIKKDKNGKYSDQNAISDYVVQKDDKGLSGHEKSKRDGFAPSVPDDEIPF